MAPVASKPAQDTLSPDGPAIHLVPIHLASGLLRALAVVLSEPDLTTPRFLSSALNPSASSGGRRPPGLLPKNRSSFGKPLTRGGSGSGREAGSAVQRQAEVAGQEPSKPRGATMPDESSVSKN